jgi:ubiquinone/menaquinone biosynthesis C-methylase UbiE
VPLGASVGECGGEMDIMVRFHSKLIKMENAEMYKALQKHVTRYSDCPYCNGKENKSVLEIDSFKIVECSSCATQYTNPYLDDEGISLAYTNYSDDRVDGELRKKREIMYKQDYDLIKHFFTPGKILDIGGCDGGFLKHFPNNNDKYLVDIDPSLKEKTKGQDIDFKIYDGISVPHEDSTFDLVSLRGVIEHVVKPRETLKEAYRILKKGGTLFITATPDKDSFAYFVYKQYWSQFHPVFHYTHVGSKTINKILTEMGFEKSLITHPYFETPYENLESDYSKVVSDIKNDTLSNGSPAFMGTMMSGVWKK